MHFLKGVFSFPQNFTPYNSKIISRRNLKFSRVGFGYKITPYTNFDQNQRGNGEKFFFVMISHGMTRK